MKWLTLRQHYIEIIVLAVFLTFFSVIAINNVNDIKHYYADQRLLAISLAESYPVYFSAALPALMGAFIAAPLISREIENSTLQFVLTQSLTRKKWFLGKFGNIAIIVIVMFGLFAISQQYFYQYATKISNPWNWFDIHIALYMAYVVLALSVGTFVGILIGKQVPAMAAFLGIFSLLRLGLFYLRPHWLKPLVLIWDFAGENPRFNSEIWVVSSHLIDKLGNEVTIGLKQLGCDPTVPMMINSEVVADLEYGCFQRAGLLTKYIYHPLDHFSKTLSIEVAIVLIISIVSIALTLWLLKKRKR